MLIRSPVPSFRRKCPCNFHWNSLFIPPQFKFFRQLTIMLPGIAKRIVSKLFPSLCLTSRMPLGPHRQWLLMKSFAFHEFSLCHAEFLMSRHLNNISSRARVQPSDALLLLPYCDTPPSTLFRDVLLKLYDSPLRILIFWSCWTLWRAHIGEAITYFMARTVCTGSPLLLRCLRSAVINKILI